jgi:ribonuclease VapC
VSIVSGIAPATMSVLEAISDMPTPDGAGAFISALNAAGVQVKLVKLGIYPTAAWEAVLGSVREVIAFDAKQAEVAGNLISLTSALDLSLGDRACLALARILQLPVYTADRAWRELSAGVEINVIR